MTIRKLHSNNVTENRADIATQYTELFFDDATNSILLPDPTGLLETKIGATSSGSQLPGFKSGRVDDGVEVTLDTIVVKLSTAQPRSLQFKLTTGTMNVNISGIIYWTTNGVGNVGSNYWQSKTLNTTWQQPFGWDFPWANDNAVYNLQDLTNGRFYRITLSIGPGYKDNFIVMERLV
jgi:hypothetical protein